ncbi:TM0106 family RecB-like putative nuclease [Terracoccus luteus]|uniref:DNA2/NAM7 helicase-like C-terminal domain-containing protein n=1 Tax=Terracoccus luteus TaxID=53356 RepID=A0A839PZ69_9MICO|nr:TM0106 family RecB-like putative nuclease [Terracoccus luteus]MBB2988443.1 uncharacterized protein [Terracoccus luteus]MCP2174102.1 uncharacterized protein [Terracoccus luteus]
MQLVDARWVHNSGDLSDLLACEIRSRLLRAHAAGIPDSPAPRVRPTSSPALAGIQRREQAQLERFRHLFGSDGVVTIDGPGTAEAYEVAAAATGDALRDHVPVIHRAVLHNGSGYELVPFLVTADPDDAQLDDDQPRYEPWLVTSTRHATPEDVLTASAHADALARAEAATGTMPGPRMHLVLGDGQTRALPIADFAAVHDNVRDRLLALLAEPAELPARRWAPEQPACPACPFAQHCASERERSRDLSLVSGLRTDHARKLTAAGVHTLEDLAAAADSGRPATLSERAFQQLREQARLQVEQDQTRTAHDPVVTVTYRVTRPSALARVADPAVGDLYATVRADDAAAGAGPRTLAHLWALADTAAGEGAVWWAVTAAEEKVAFEAFVDAVTARLREHPDAHVFHFGVHAPEAMKRAAATHSTREAEVDALLRAGALVDLHAVVRAALLVSQRSTALHHLEPLYRVGTAAAGDPAQRADGEMSSAQYLTLLDAAADVIADTDAGMDAGTGAAAEARAAMEGGARRECASVAALRQWLTMLRDTTSGAADPDTVPGPGSFHDLDRPGADEKATARTDALAAEAGLVGALTARGVRELTVLAGTLGYYRREANPAWWDFFAQAETPLSELEVSPVCAVPVSVHADDGALPAGRTRNAKRQLRLRCDPDLPHPFTVGDTVRLLYPSDGASATTNAVVTGAGAVSLEVLESVKPDQIRHSCPAAVLPGPPVSPAPKDAAVATLAASLAGGTTTGDARGADEIDTEADAAPGAGPGLAAGVSGPAVLDLLARRAPRLRPGGTLPSVTAHDGDVVATVIDAVDALDRSYLAVQGPPGAWKTYLATRLIEHLVATARTVGVCSTSHKAVENVLSGLDATRIPVAKRPSGQPDPAHPWEQPRTNDALAAWRMTHPDGHVIGGTAWTFANAAIAHDPVDVLIIDEAGQFALTDVLAVSAAARKLVLLGDPQQLPQLVAGTHPDGVDASALGHLLDGAEIVPGHLGYFLAVSRRMHPAVCAPVSALSYQGLLRSHPTAAGRGVAGVEPGLHYLPVEHEGNTTLAIEEVAAVVETVRALVGRVWSDQGESRPLRASDVLVVTPFNRQVRAVRRALDTAALPEVRVGTVDKFQGQEAPVVVTSLTASSSADLPRGIDFLLSRNRMNVALSRARAVAVVVASPELARSQVSSVEQLRLVSGLLGLLAGAHSWAAPSDGL